MIPLSLCWFISFPKNSTGFEDNGLLCWLFSVDVIWWISFFLQIKELRRCNFMVIGWVVLDVSICFVCIVKQLESFCSSESVGGLQQAGPDLNSSLKLATRKAQNTQVMRAYPTLCAWRTCCVLGKSDSMFVVVWFNMYSKKLQVWARVAVLWWLLSCVKWTVLVCESNSTIRWLFAIYCCCEWHCQSHQISLLKGCICDYKIWRATQPV